jgi:hypothetical protein
VEGPPIAELADVLRFDITPAWITQRWPRVMNARSGSSEQVYRVPLVTGAKPSDLAGSLTYYFDEEQHLRRIYFQGHTGDAAPLVDHLAQHHKFQRHLSGDPSQTLYEVRGSSTNRLVVRNSPLIDASQPQTRYRLELLLERPSAPRTQQ